MATIKAIVRDGRIEVAERIDLPDGTELTIPLPNQEVIHSGEDRPDTPEAIEAWLRWYDALDPVEFTPSELEAWAVARQQQRQLELAQWEMQSERLEGHFP